MVVKEVSDWMSGKAPCQSRPAGFEIGAHNRVEEGAGRAVLRINCGSREGLFSIYCLALQK